MRVTIGLILVVMLVKAMDPYVGNTSDKEHSIAKNLLEQADQWYLVSVQDTNSSSKYQHISYAAAYLHAARYVVNDAVLERLTGIDVHKLQSAIDTHQRATSADLLRQCPRLKVNPKAAAKPAKRTAWL